MSNTSRKVILDTKKYDRRCLGRENACTLEAISVERRQEMWDLHSTSIISLLNEDQAIPCSACWLWTGPKQNGYPALSMGHAQSKVKVHILAAWTRYHHLPRKNEVVSHLCHRKLCVNPMHLVIETISMNNARKGCLCALLDGTGNAWILCSHYPRCIRRDTDNLGSFEPHIHKV